MVYRLHTHVHWQEFITKICKTHFGSDNIKLWTITRSLRERKKVQLDKVYKKRTEEVRREEENKKEREHIGYKTLTSNIKN